MKNTSNSSDNLTNNIKSTDLGSLIGNLHFTIWKFQVFSATQILLEINFGHFEAPKTAILTICAALNFKILTFSSVNLF